MRRSPAAGSAWEKLGRVYVASGERPWAQSHAFLPTVLQLDDERLRIYVAFLDRERVGRIGFVDVSARDPSRVLDVSPSPVLDIGRAGTFDDNGVTPMWVIAFRGRLLLYYTGWQVGHRVRYFLFAGLAASDDGGNTFHRLSEVPILDRCDGELFVRTAPCVLREGDRWRMWYIGGERWIEEGGKQVPSYNMRYLESGDPTRWKGGGRVCLDLAGGDEYGLGRPCVVKEGETYRLFYSVRLKGLGYRLGYAESVDGLSWTRKDEDAGICVSESGWDSEMVCYSSVVATRYGTYLFYNGNNYGETGFGVAVLR